MKSKKNSGLYIHFPICRQKCIYCDFFSAGEKALDKMSLEECLLSELRERREELPYPPSTIYLGGGTPSLMPSECIGRILDAVKIIYPGVNPEEVTMEVNPDDVTEKAAREWSSYGINRISMGVQSLNNSELKAIGRRHSAEKALVGMEILKKYFSNISVDLIFGLPGQTMESWRKTVDGIIKMRPNHISAYALMLEPGTAMTVLVEAGRVEVPGDDLTEQMFLYLTEKLEEAGYLRYETSNYSLPGFESKHNNLYWHGAPYLGIGPSAHSYDGYRIRRWNPANLKEYMQYYGATSKDNRQKDSHFYDEEKLSDEELKEEYILTRLRLTEGIGLDDFRTKFGEEALEKLIKNARKDIRNGRLIQKDGMLFLSRSGVMTEDDVIVNLSM